MSITINMVGGGGISNNNALIVARIPSGSTATATKGSMTLTPKMWVSGSYSNTDVAIFVILPSQFDSATPWTITATDGTSTVNEEVYVTTNKEYDVTITFNLVLWDYDRDGYAGLHDVATIDGYGDDTDDGDCVLCSAYRAGYYSYVLFNRVVDMTNFTTLKVIGNSGSRGGSSLGIIPQDSTEYALHTPFDMASVDEYTGAENVLNIATYNNQGRVLLRTDSPTTSFQLFISHVELLP